ncbi:3-hydroxyisobutyrate dehydrogenase [Legionella massiliensis]|uniref:3-hydroxyisobutyrate dehydrogenase n=1 Tax=Legionella massiliensis TaxID=1034943 RepID=A0A078KSU7_9GAMM|nr:3-hydroxyisobutyrate dehydrogenase [Legionella massiliensis]CDZ76022.1 3-hydroxyisobutyrate dehydrogenase [Legionella massiliensis]CEE11760.1 3-hydroxyisobutyrate dehydrogenase [Legionella massiliensis]
MARIGFVGLGHMGLPMAINLVKAGHIVTGFDLEQQAVVHLATAGGLAAQSLKDAAVNQDVIITMLQSGSQVQQVCLDDQGLFAHAVANSLYIDCSSIDVPSSRELHQQAMNHNLLVVDAPVSGGVAGAAAATLTFMVGGQEQSFDQAKPILTAMGKKIIHTGPAGSGQAAKICNNMILGISMIAISEAFILAENLGLSAQKLFEVVGNSSGQCWAMSQYVPVPGILPNVPANRDYQPGFTSAMMLKDLKLSQSSASTVGIETPLGAQATAIYQQFNDEGHKLLDFSAIIKALAQGQYPHE